MPLDPLRLFWRHDIPTRRRLGAGGRGERFADRETIRGFWDVRASQSASTESDVTTFDGAVFFPAGTDAIPLGSMLERPAHITVGPAEVRVVEIAIADGPHGPNHVELKVAG